MILLTQSDGTIVGYGLTGYPRKDVIPAVNNRSAGDSGWHGHFSVEQPSVITAYALLEGNKAVCALRNRQGATSGGR